jgi:hypothetical protein
VNYEAYKEKREILANQRLMTHKMIWQLLIFPSPSSHLNIRYVESVTCNDDLAYKARIVNDDDSFDDDVETMSEESNEWSPWDPRIALFPFWRLDAKQAGEFY